MFQTSNNYDSKNLLTIYHSAGRIWEAVKIPMMELTSDVVGNLPPIYLRRNQRHQVKPLLHLVEYESSDNYLAKSHPSTIIELDDGKI